jgi:hypothetical protein
MWQNVHRCRNQQKSFTNLHSHHAVTGAPLIGADCFSAVEAGKSHSMSAAMHADTITCKTLAGGGTPKSACDEVCPGDRAAQEAGFKRFRPVCGNTPPRRK